MPSLRTPEGKKRYQEYMQSAPMNEECTLCKKPAIQEYKYWKITENRFPYDLIAETHTMIMPIRHVTEMDLTHEEKGEFLALKMNTLAEVYDYIIEPTSKNKSIPGHFHLHLIVGKSSKPKE